MNLYSLLQQRAETSRPIRLGVIGAGKFASMFLSQVRLTPGIQLVGIAELDVEKAKQACLKTGLSEDMLLLGNSIAAINNGAHKGKIVLTEDSYQLIQADLDIILEITGVPEVGVYHAWNALDAGKHVVMVNVEADALLGVVYLTMGRYDEILIVEGPSDTVAATLALSAGSEGNVRTETLKAFPEAEYRNIISKIP